MRHTQLRSFHAVAQSGSFTAAARELGVSQPTITTQVKSLEDEFGIELFVRRGRRIELTETGGGLLDITRRLFADEKEAADYLNETRELKTGHLRVGAVGPYHVTDMLAAFNARYPGLYVSVTVGNSRQTVADLLDYRTDVAVLAHVDPDPRLVAIPYRRHRVVVMCPADHAFARRRGAAGARDGRPAPDRARSRLDDAPRLRPGDARGGRRAAGGDGDRQPRIDPRSGGQGDRPRRGVGGGVHPRPAHPRPAGHGCGDLHLRPCRASAASGRTPVWSGPSLAC